MWKIIVKKKVGKELSRLPLTVRARLLVLLDHLAAKGPVQPMWPNYSKLSKTSYLI